MLKLKQIRRHTALCRELRRLPAGDGIRPRVFLQADAGQAQRVLRHGDVARGFEPARHGERALPRQTRQRHEQAGTRISINPQTFSDEVLAGIGRKHSAQDILDCYAEARKAGHDDINMDLIAGLPGDTVESFEHSLRQAIALDPENITVHTLALKKGARLRQEETPLPSGTDVAAMLDFAWAALRQAGYLPYYLYRQKFMSGSFENVGWCISGALGEPDGNFQKPGVWQYPCH